MPDVDLQLEVELQRKLRAAIEARLLKSAHDCAEGGLAVALAECCIFSGSNGGAQFGDPDASRPAAPAASSAPTSTSAPPRP